VLSALRALSNFADSLYLTSNPSSLNPSVLADIIFSPPHIASLCRILLQSSSAPSIQSQISQTTYLISKLCRDERHQLSLSNTGVLEALATRLASVVVAQGLVLPGAELVAQKEGLMEHFPPPAPSIADLAGILEAIAVIIADSKLRASQLLYSNAIMAIFPSSSLVEIQATRSTKAAWNAFNAADLSSRQSQLSVMDYLIPHVPLNRTKSAAGLASAFPPLGTPGSFEHLIQLGGSRIPTWSSSSSFETGVVSHDPISSDTNDPESPLIAYLIWLARSTKDLERLMAASVLTVLYRAGLTAKSRETALGLLIVPILVQLLRDDRTSIRSTGNVITESEQTAIEWKIRERTPAVLAMLIVDSEYLQKCAYEAGVIKMLSDMIKAAYDPVVDLSHRDLWSPQTGETLDGGLSSASPSSQLGPSGQSPLLTHKIKVRENTLRAIAALVPFKDEYRKALIDQGVVPYIVESLKSYPDKPSSKVTEKAEKVSQIAEENKMSSSGLGINPVSVLIAACGAVRHLSRSVSTLRTTLIDNGVVMPVFNLLQHSDIDVQISATAATCNLVMDFSPMREVNMCPPLSHNVLTLLQTITGAGVLKILCEHAHSGNVKLRLNALWALKHLVQSAENDIKKTCLEELGQGWLVQLICDDTEDEAASLAKSSSGHFGSHTEVDDIQMEQSEVDDESGMNDSIGALANKYDNFDMKPKVTNYNPINSHGQFSSIAHARLAALRELETDPARRAKKDDIAVQEQGLDFIRNLIGGFNNLSTSETSEMIDFLLNALGQDQIFEILASKLRYKVINPFNNKRGPTPGSVETRFIPPQAEIIAAVEYILVHMAASVPRHRQLVISQTELLKLLIPQFSHPNKEVRIALCWLVINLTWVGDTHDGQACAQRVQELKKLGFLAKLEGLEHDVELDVRERAKTAIWNMKQGY
jgi:hypothetical protein